VTFDDVPSGDPPPVLAPAPCSVPTEVYDRIMLVISPHLELICTLDEVAPQRGQVLRVAIEELAAQLPKDQVRALARSLALRSLKQDEAH